MIGDIIVIDDIIPKKYQDCIQDTFFGSNFSWFFEPDITFVNKQIDNYGFHHTFQRNTGEVNSEFLKFVMPLVFTGVDKLKVDYTEVIQARAFLQTLREDKKLHNKPHVDLHYPHLVFLYYVNQTDGDTFIFEETSKDTFNIKKDHQFKIKKRVSPKKGRGVFFNGESYHASSNPTGNPRCVINFDLK